MKNTEKQGGGGIWMGRPWWKHVLLKLFVVALVSYFLLSTFENQTWDSIDDGQREKERETVFYEGASSYEKPIAVFGSLQYRRVCSPIGLSSVVCMTIRFPWSDGVQLQDESFSFAQPVDERFHYLDKERSLVIVDGDLLEECKQLEDDTDGFIMSTKASDDLSPLDNLVKSCLDMVAAKQPRLSVVVVFFREQKRKNKEQRQQQWGETTATRQQRKMGSNSDKTTTGNEDIIPSSFLFGTGHAKQLNNVRNFFDGQFVPVMGDSTAPGVATCITQLFGDTCVRFQIWPQAPSMYCGDERREDTNYNPTHRRVASNNVVGVGSNEDTGDSSSTEGINYNSDENLFSEEALQQSRSLTWTDMDEYVYMGVIRYAPFFEARYGYIGHTLPQVPLARLMMADQLKRKPGWTDLRDLTFIIQYPFAHTQLQAMIYNEWDVTVEMQEKFPELIMSVQSEEGRNGLKEIGWNLKRVIVFDGLPQYFPSDSSAYFGTVDSTTERAFLDSNGYPPIGNSPGWRPELGSKCRGPVPGTSNMTSLHLMGRKSFERSGLDMQFYIPNWEFSNQFWWLTVGWNGRDMDCTHGRVEVYYSIHKYLMQAMIDDYYENI